MSLCCFQRNHLSRLVLRSVFIQVSNGIKKDGRVIQEVSESMIAAPAQYASHSEISRVNMVNVCAPACLEGFPANGTFTFLAGHHRVEFLRREAVSNLDVPLSGRLLADRRLGVFGPSLIAARLAVAIGISPAVLVQKHVEIFKRKRLSALR